MFLAKKHKKYRGFQKQIGDLLKNIENCKKTIHIAQEKYIIESNLSPVGGVSPEGAVFPAGCEIRGRLGASGAVPFFG